MELGELREKVLMAKKHTLELCMKARHGHISSAFSCAEIVAVLYYEVMRYSVNDPYWSDRDHFIMSKNHASIILMPILNDIGFISDSDYKTVMSEGSERTHHTNINFPGMDFTGGALGIGLGMACGLAKAAKLKNNPCLTFCIVGDAECCEGSIWESVMFAGHNRLNNLVVIVDNNNMGVTDYTENMIQMEPMEERWRSFGFETRRVNGHDLESLLRVFADVRERKDDRPLCIIADTLKGKGLSIMENKLLWHGTVPGTEYEKQAFHELEEEYR